MRYLFYPWDDGTGIKTLDALAPGVGTAGGTVASPAIGEILCDNGTYPGGLWGVGPHDEVFVIGHAAEGMKVMADANKKQYDQTEVVDRLHKCGLRKTVNCRITLYACESGKGGTDSLAAKVADALKTNGFACQNNVWGFNQKVGMAAHNGALCINSGGQWIDYTTVNFALAHHLPVH